MRDGSNRQKLPGVRVGTVGPTIENKKAEIVKAKSGKLWWGRAGFRQGKN
jgi:hypothetical protein